MKCPKCGRVIEENSAFCEYCGHKIKKSRWPWFVLIAAVITGTIVAVVINHNQKQVSVDKKEESLYKNCQSAADYRYYLSAYPDGQYAVMARNKLEELKQDSVRQQLDLEAAERIAYENCVSQKDCKVYLEKYPRGEYVSQVQQLLSRLQQDSLDQLLMQSKENYYEELDYNVRSAPPTSKSHYEQLLDSDMQHNLLNESALYSLTPRELTYLRNSVYARHGYVFKSNELNQYFKKFSWYHSDPNFTSSELNATEQANVTLINTYQKDYGKKYKPL